MTTDEAKPEHDYKVTDPAAIVSITRRILSGVMRFCLIVIDVPNTLHPTRIRRPSGHFARTLDNLDRRSFS
jgi:hypothetical protein